MNEAMSENGIVMATMIVALQRPRKMNTTSTTNTRASMIVPESVSTVMRMFSDVSAMIPIFTSEGRRFCNSGKASRTALAIATELPPDCFWMMIIAPCWPSVNVSCARSCTLSWMVATSLRNTFTPLKLPTTMSYISLGSLNSPSTRSEYVLLPISNVPPGMLRFSAPIAALTDSMGMLYASILAGSIYTLISRSGAPEIDTVPTPSIRASGFTTLSSSILYSAAWLSSAFTESIMIGIMSVENLKMIGLFASSGSADATMSSLSRTSLVRSSMS